MTIQTTSLPFRSRDSGAWLLVPATTATRPRTISRDRTRTAVAEPEAVPSAIVQRAGIVAAVLGLLVVDSGLWGRATAALAAAGIGTTPAALAAGARAAAAAPGAIVVVVAAGAVLLAAAAIAALCRGSRVLDIAAVAVLAAALAIATASAAVNLLVTDEGVLTAQAATALLHGSAVYGASWPGLFTGSIPLTPLMSGGFDTTYIYPPLTMLLSAGAHTLFGVPLAAAPGVVGVAALSAAAIAAFVLVPRPWRALSTLLLLGPAPLITDALGGYPAVVAVALLVPVVALWPRIAAARRLGAAGLAAAVCLGLACAAHQLAWFLVPFLLLGVLQVALGHGRGGVWLTVRFATLAALAWGAANAPLALQQPVAWSRSLVLPFTQDAIVHGQGVVDLTMFLRPGSGWVEGYDLASDALLAAAAVALLFAPARLAVAIPLLPALALFLSPRSPADYLLLFGPLWLVALVTAPPAVLDRAWHPPLPRAVPLRALGVVVLLLPAALLVAGAVTAPQPLAMQVTQVRQHDGRATAVVLQVHDTSATPIRPTYLSRIGTHPDTDWRVVDGPAVVAPGATATVVLAPTAVTTAKQVVEPGVQARMLAISAAPLTLSSTALP